MNAGACASSVPRTRCLVAFIPNQSIPPYGLLRRALFRRIVATIVPCRLAAPPCRLLPINSLEAVRSFLGLVFVHSISASPRAVQPAARLCARMALDAGAYADPWALRRAAAA